MGVTGINDNPAKILPGNAVRFPNTGPHVGTGITSFSPTQINLADIGTYLVQFQVCVTEAGQLVVALNGAENSNTVVGRATGTSQIVGIYLVNTSVPNTKLTIQNPIGDDPLGLIITPGAGGARPVTAHLVITQVQ
jgi:hypothetical protein